MIRANTWWTSGSGVDPSTVRSPWRPPAPAYRLKSTPIPTEEQLTTYSAQESPSGGEVAMTSPRSFYSRDPFGVNSAKKGAKTSETALFMLCSACPDRRFGLGQGNNTAGFLNRNCFSMIQGRRGCHHIIHFLNLPFVGRCSSPDDGSGRGVAGRSG